MHIGEFVLRNARRMPDRAALVWRNERFTWGDFNGRVNRLADVLRRLGAGPGTAIASLLDNSNSFLELNFAAAKIGAILVPVMPRSVPREIAHVLKDVGARIVVADSAARDALSSIGESVGTLEAVITVASGDASDIERLMHDAAADEPGIRVDEDSIGLIKYTSGTSGVPKGCARTHRQTALAALLYVAHVPHLESDRATISSPLAAGFAISLANAMALGGTTIHVLPKFEPRALLEAIERERITLAYAIQSTFNSFTRHPDLDRFDLSSLRLFTGTSATQDTLLGLQRLRRHPSFKGEFVNAYGSSEAGGYISYNMPEDYERALAEPSLAQRVESIGREAMLCRIECMDEKLSAMPGGEVGEMAIRAPTVDRKSVV